jgi:hypothetical protein
MAIPEKHLIVIVPTNLQGANPQNLAADIARSMSRRWWQPRRSDADETIGTLPSC